MRGSRNFRQGGGGPGQSDNVFLVLSLFYRSQMVNFKETFHFSRFERGSNIFQGVQLYPEGVFQGGPDPLSPSGSALVHLKLDIWPYCSHTALVWYSENEAKVLDV